VKAKLTRTVTIELGAYSLAEAFVQLSATDQVEFLNLISAAFDSFGKGGEGQAQLLSISIRLARPENSAAKRWLHDLMGYLEAQP